LPCPRQRHAVRGSRYGPALCGSATGRCPPATNTPRPSATPSRPPDAIFLDKASGKLARRPELDKALLSANRAGDQLVITKLDRLGRSLEHLIELSKHLQAKGVDLVVLDQGIDTSTAVGRMFFQILGAIAEFEHALMSERTLDGLAAARARGRTGGQKPKLGPRQMQLARQMYDELGEDGKRRYTVAQIAAEFGVTRPTIYRHLSKTTAPATS
jgi:DNA invertase Pin-like site-specific DNA recombinase